MGYRKKQKRGPEKKSLLESLNPDEAAIVLRRFVAAHPELETEGEAMTKTLLREDSFEQIAEDVYDSVQVLGYDELIAIYAPKGTTLLDGEIVRHHGTKK